MKKVGVRYVLESTINGIADYGLAIMIIINLE